MRRTLCGSKDERVVFMRVAKVVIRLTEELYEDLRSWDAVGNSQRDARCVGT